jgi:signal-transduction protein with cAMP-binding, CBS, and nucleotidyltransferase domain
MKTIENLLEEHPFFAKLNPDFLDTISGCGQNVVFEADQEIGREGDPVNCFYVIRHGLVTIKSHVPGRAPIKIQTLQEGDILGWSWLFPPWQWQFSSQAETLTRMIQIDAKCLREKCEKDPAMGFELAKRFAKVMVERLTWTRLQLMKIYDVPN